MGDYHITHGGGGGGGGPPAEDCCECSLTLELDPIRTYQGPGTLFGQWHWDVTTSVPTSGNISYDGGLARVTISEAGTYHLECTLVGQVENAAGPWDYMTIQGYTPSFAAPLDLVFNCHLFSSGADSISNSTSVRTIVVTPAMLPYTMEFAVIMRDVPAPNLLTIFARLTNLRIRRICDESPAPVVNDPPTIVLPPYGGGLPGGGPGVGT